MRFTQLFIPTLKETPADAEVISQKLMLRAGMIRKTSSGVYSWLPLGLRILKKVENIVREEMNRSGALELLLPSVQPAELWQETGRWNQYGRELLKFKDRHERDFCYGPTHEEVITDVMRKELKSYKQLPINVYQIQTKFRDEIRPRFGVMRAREFIMKDAYSFHINQESLQKTYENMYETYSRIFSRLGLEFRAVEADTGSIGGNASHEFQVLANSGEDVIAISTDSQYAANVELAESLAPSDKSSMPTKSIEKTSTPDTQSIEEVCAFLKVSPEKTIKTLIAYGTESKLVALVVRGDHELNTVKAEKLAEVAKPFTLATEQDIQTIIGCKPGYIGVVNLDMPIIVDRDAVTMSDFICGANEDHFHHQNVNWNRDAKFTKVVAIRKVIEGDLSPDGKGKLKLVRGIEVGHIFQLGDKYSKSMNASVLDENGKDVIMQMGCYGIGVSRIVAAAIEQNNDEQGILWPDAMAPFHVVIIPINMHKSERVKKYVDDLYKKLQEKNIEVLLDDRNERPGVMFAEADLIGIPHRVVIGEKALDQNCVEYKNRKEKESKLISENEFWEAIK